MSDPEDFLTRWSRRKRQAVEEPVAPSDDGAQCTSDESPAKPAEGPAARPAVEVMKADTPESVLDLSKLPSIESITAETDIRVFLAPGVPMELRLAALRRAWVADPKVRDFVGLADYDFDFHTPGAIPGFGSLEMTDELRREVTRIVSAWQAEPRVVGPAAAQEPDTGVGRKAPTGQPAVAPEETKPVPNPGQPAPVVNSDASTDQPASAQDELINDKEDTRRVIADAAVRQQHSPAENLQTLARRGHGGALPK
jgi:hypothetical protein